MSLLNRIRMSIHIRRKNKRIINRILNQGGRIDNGVKLSIADNSKFIIGNNIVILSSGIEAIDGCRIAVLPNATLKIGDNTGMYQVSITCKNKIEIGSYCTIGAGVMMFDTDFHNTDWKIRRTKEDLKTSKSAPISIGDDCFIGARTIICKGVQIGHRTIIAAGSVVVSDLPDDCIAGGNPCEIIKKL